VGTRERESEKYAAPNVWGYMGKIRIPEREFPSYNHLGLSIGLLPL
jgi:hypothetical protein